MDKIAVLIPCYNEEKGVVEVLTDLPHEWFATHDLTLDVIVIDNNSTDNTARVASELGARVVSETRKGKGYALVTGMRAVTPDTAYVLMIDGDNTYKSYEIPRMLEPLMSGFCDVVIGSRLNGKITNNSMRFANKMGNKLFSILVQMFYAPNVNDVLSGYYAWRSDVIVELRDQLVNGDFRIEMEMLTKMARMNYSIFSVPITYDERIGQSHLKILHDGRLIFGEFFRNLRWESQIAHERLAAQSFFTELADINNVSNINKLRIAFVSDAIYPYNKGGKEKRLYEMSTRLAAKGHDVQIYSMKWWQGPNKIRTEDNITLHAISGNIPLYSNGHRSIRQAIYYALTCVALLWQSYDVVDVDSMPHFPVLVMRFVTLLKRKPMFVTWHEAWGRAYWMKYLGPVGIIGAFIEKLAFALSPNVVSVSRHTTNRLREEFGATDAVTTLPIGLDVLDIAAIPAAGKKIDLIFAGRLLSNKNVDQLIHALHVLRKMHCELQCVIIGEGPEKGNLVRLATELGLTDLITFHDFYEDTHELFAQIKAAKCFVLPSTREGFGISVLEANACGVPVIVINHPDNAAKDLVKQGINGFICDLNASSISDTIQMVLSRDMSESSYRSVLSYEWSHVIDNYELMYQSSMMHSNLSKVFTLEYQDPLGTSDTSPMNIDAPPMSMFLEA